VVDENQWLPGADTILVVEDDSDTREALCEWLKRRGLSVACAANGLSALHEIRTLRDPPALILLDLFMPVMDGYAFLQRVRQDSHIKHVPIVVMTGDLWAPPSDADAILTKPFKSEILLHTIQRFLKPAET
jgi:two-component system response regulator CpxR